MKKYIVTGARTLNGIDRLVRSAGKITNYGTCADDTQCLKFGESEAIALAAELNKTFGTTHEIFEVSK